ncbi:hypothetical protein ACFL6P_07100 [Candidatus Latescibacterota bacterium]
MSKIGKAGPQNAAILDTEKSLIEKDEKKILVLDEGLARKLKFIKEGQFKEKGGAATLKLIGDVLPVNRVEVIKKVKENLIKEYPLSAMELVDKIKESIPTANNNTIWNIIKSNDLKSNPDYSAYNFRNKKHEDNYKGNGVVPSVTPSIFNYKAVDFIINIIKSDQ